MSINFIKGDISTSPDPVIAHGCNCKGGFGSGVAGVVARKWPKARVEYKKVVRPTSLGNIQVVNCGSKVIVNMFTQLTYGRTGKHVDYEAVDDCMVKLRTYAELNLHDAVSIPRIGAGLGGGNWREIERIIREAWNGCDIALNIYSL